MKRVWILAVVIGLILLCSCSSDVVGDIQPVDIPNSQTVKITLAHCWSQQDVILQIAERYNQTHDDVYVEVEYIPVEQYVTTLKNRSVAGKLPELYMGWPGSSMEWFYQNGLAMDLSAEAWVNGLDANTKADVTYDETIRMLPLNKTFICIGYNKDMFQRLGCEAPQNYADFLEICEKLKENGVLPLAIGSRDSSGYIYSSWMMAVSDIYSFDSTYNQKLYSGAENMGKRWKQILDRQKQWIEEGYVHKDHLAIDRITEGLDTFASGEAGMFILGSWELDTVQHRMESAGAEWEIGFFPMPSATDPGILLLASGEGLCVNAGTIYKDQALDVIRFFTEKEQNQLFQTAMNSFSTFSSLDLEYDSALDQISVYVDGCKTWGYPDASWPRIIGDSFSEMFPRYLSGKISAEEFLTSMEVLWLETVQPKQE